MSSCSPSGTSHSLLYFSLRARGWYSFVPGTGKEADGQSGAVTRSRSWTETLILGLQSQSSSHYIIVVPQRNPSAVVCSLLQCASPSGGYCTPLSAYLQRGTIHESHSMGTADSWNLEPGLLRLPYTFSSPAAPLFLLSMGWRDLICPERFS